MQLCKTLTCHDVFRWYPEYASWQEDFKIKISFKLRHIGFFGNIFLDFWLQAIFYSWWRRKEWTAMDWDAVLMGRNTQLWSSTMNLFVLHIGMWMDYYQDHMTWNEAAFSGVDSLRQCRHGIVFKFTFLLSLQLEIQVVSLFWAYDGHINGRSIYQTSLMQIVSSIWGKFSDRSNMSSMVHCG